MRHRCEDCLDLVWDTDSAEAIAGIRFWTDDTARDAAGRQKDYTVAGRAADGRDPMLC